MQLGLIRPIVMGLTISLAAIAYGDELTGAGLNDPLDANGLPPVVASQRVASHRSVTNFDVGPIGSSIAEASVEPVQYEHPEFCAPPCPSLACDLTPACWHFEFEYLHWQPHQRGLDFAVAENGDAITVGVGQIHNLELDRDNGMRGGIAYQTKTGWTFGGRYTYFDSDGTATVNRPPGVGELFATRSHPDTNEEAETATATGAIDYRVFELNAGRSIYRNRFSNVSVFGGIRYSELSQRLRLDYDGRDFVNGVVATSTDIDGFGVHVGAEGHWRMAKGFGLFARVSTGLTHGDFDTTLYESNLNGAQLITDVQDHFNQSVPILELRTGLSWQCRGLDLSVGYELTNWFNVGNRSQLIDDIHEGLYGPFSSDILFEGLFGRASYSF